jgi:Lrp/AsnC family transcriptional regulator, regulator for asnA, asnC and gidA
MENIEGRTLFDLDEIDLRIVYLLQDNGRRSNSEIARSVGVSEPTARKRIERLMQDGIIKVEAILNPRRSGYSAQAHVGIHCVPGRTEEVGEQLADLNEVVYVGYMAGRYDILIEVMLRDQDELFHWLSRRLADFPGIADVETFYILRTAKINYDWKLPPDMFERVRLARGERIEDTG